MRLVCGVWNVNRDEVKFLIRFSCNRLSERGYKQIVNMFIDAAIYG